MAEVGNMPQPPKVLRLGVTDMVRISDARMSGTAYAGLAMTSHSTTVATATFSNVALVTAPSAPGGLSVVQQNGAAVLNWTASAAGTNGLGGYYVYRSDLTTPLATVTSGTTYSDPTPAANVSYGYYVVAFDRTAPTPFASAPSASVSFKLTGSVLPPSTPLALMSSAASLMALVFGTPTKA
jgi:hypothetical protein